MKKYAELMQLDDDIIVLRVSVKNTAEAQLENGTITAADAITYPSENSRDQQINSDAIPKLTSETLSAQSAQIDMISGATYTSRGYLESLQSALDQAQCG